MRWFFVLLAAVSTVGCFDDTCVGRLGPARATVTPADATVVFECAGRTYTLAPQPAYPDPTRGPQAADPGHYAEVDVNPDTRWVSVHVRFSGEGWTLTSTVGFPADLPNGEYDMVNRCETFGVCEPSRVTHWFDVSGPAPAFPMDSWQVDGQVYIERTRNFVGFEIDPESLDVGERVTMHVELRNLRWAGTFDGPCGVGQQIDASAVSYSIDFTDHAMECGNGGWWK